MIYFNNNEFDSNDYNQCVQRGMNLILNREKQTLEEGGAWNINTNACRSAIEQSILNRYASETMMSAVIRYVDKIEFKAE